MTREQFESTVKDLIMQAQNVEACADWGDRSAKREAQAELKDCSMMVMAEFDRLTAENEQLRERVAELENKTPENSDA